MFGDLDALLAPMGAARFFSEHYEKQPLHLPARGGARHAILGHEALLDAHRDLSDAQSELLNARLILLLANHIGDLGVLREALRIAREEV